MQITIDKNSFLYRFMKTWALNIAAAIVVVLAFLVGVGAVTWFVLSVPLWVSVIVILAGLLGTSAWSTTDRGGC